MEEMPSLCWVSSRFALAAAKASRDFLEASIAEFTSFACKQSYFLDFNSSKQSHKHSYKEQNMPNYGEKN